MTFAFFEVVKGIYLFTTGIAGYGGVGLMKISPPSLHLLLPLSVHDYTRTWIPYKPAAFLRLANQQRCMISTRQVPAIMHAKG
jgi:hypothetical protein